MLAWHAKMKTNYLILSLIIVSIISGIIWRLEVEYHGWHGLTWLTYFHLAIPIGFGLFLVWSNYFIKIKPKNRILINLAGIIYSILLYYGLGISLTYLFLGGPSGLLLFVQTPKWMYYLFQYSIFFLIPFIPIGTYLLMKIFRIHPSLKFLILRLLELSFQFLFQWFY
jgi:hypothetical protein